MILLDTNILIEILKGDRDTIASVESLQGRVAISSISAMELCFGALDKREVKKIEKFLTLFEVVHVSNKISLKATNLILKYAKSHTLDIPDSLIAATAIVNNCSLWTYNLKDFRYIVGLDLK